MAQLEDILYKEDQEKLEQQQKQAADKAWRKSSFASKESAGSNLITAGIVAIGAMTLANPVVGFSILAVAALRLFANKANADKAAEEAKEAAREKFVTSATAALELRSKQIEVARQELEFEFRRQQLNGGGQQSDRVQMPKEEEQAKIVMPNAQQPVAEATTKPQNTTEFGSSETTTPEQVTKAQAATLENPLNETLGAAQQNAEGKIVRPVLDVPALLAQTKTNANGIDAKIDAAMGKSPTDKDVMESLNKFTAILAGNMQKRGATNATKGEQGTDEYKAYQVHFAQAVQDSMRAAGAYTLQTNVEGAGRTFELKTPIAAGKVGRHVGNSANYALNGVEPNFNKQEAIMNKAAGLSAIQAQKDFQTDGKFDAKKVAEAFGRGDFDSLKGNDKRIEALYDAAKMVTEQHKKEQVKEQPKVEQTIEVATNEQQAQNSIVAFARKQATASR